MNTEKVTKLLFSLIDSMETLHSLWVEEKDKAKRDLLFSSLNCLEEAEDKLKKAYFEQVEESINKA